MTAHADLDGYARDMTRLGTLVFTFKGSRCSPRSEGNTPRLFVPFSDLTSGTETYQAGRYMELNLADRHHIVDFNIAYQPHCYYNAEHECPLPPRENRLTVPIRAGERLRNADTTVTR